MKNFSNRIALTYVAIVLFFTILAHKYIADYYANISIDKYIRYSFLFDIFLVVISGLIFYYILIKNFNKNKFSYKKLENKNIEILKTNELYDIVAKATSDTILDWDLDSDTITWNNGIRDIFGYDEDNLGNTSTWWFSKIHPEDSLKTSINVYAFIEKREERWQSEYRFECANGTFKYVLNRGFLVIDSTGKPQRMIIAVQDMNKQMEEEQRLKLLETVITNSIEAVMIMDTNISDDFVPKLLYVNQAFTKITGYDRDELLKKSPSFLFDTKSDDFELERIKTAIQNYEECITETICINKKGKTFWGNLTIVPVISTNNEHTHWISFLRDITVEKQKQREREQLIKELTQNNHDLKQFSYITSHNLRAPLSNLTGLLNLLDDVEIDNPELKEILNGFSSSTNQLNDTVNDLIKVIVIKDNQTIIKEKVSLKEVFESVFSQLSYLISLNKPILKIELDDIYIADSNKSYLESIFLNLLTNAIKYKSEERPLKINVKSEIIDDKIVLQFKDNGIGIDLDRNKHKIFGLYQRFHDHPDSKGLGLYLVKSQVEAMNGTISVKSAIDKGTTFTIKFKNE